jgi:DNA modification methylase
MLHCNVPIAIEHVMQCGWKWWWIAGMRHEVYKCIPGRNLASIWTPVLWFVKNQNKQNKPRTAENLLFDMVMGTKRDKKYNRFGKPVDWFLHWVLSLTDSDSLVVDPFAGGGAVGVACVVSNRKAILMEREVRLYRVCLNRIRDAKGYQKCLDSRSLSNWSPEPTRRKGY